MIWKTDYNEQSKEIFDGIEGYFAARGNYIKDPDRSWAIIYKRELLKMFNIFYPEKVPFLEDGLFLVKVFSVAERVSFDNEDFYLRTIRPGSATHSNLFHTERAIKKDLY